MQYPSLSSLVAPLNFFPAVGPPYHRHIFLFFDGEQSLPGPALSSHSRKRKAGRSLRLVEPIFTQKTYETDLNAVMVEAAEVSILMDEMGTEGRPQIPQPKRDGSVCIDI